MTIKLQSAFFLVQWIREWECYIQQNCRTYSGTFIEQVAIGPAHFPMFANLLVFFLTFYDRSVFHVLLSVGLIINGIVVTLLGMVLSEGKLLDTGCRITVAAAPSDDVSIMWFVFLYCVVYDLRIDGCQIYRSFTTWATLVAALLTVGAQLILHLYDITEILAGLLIGLINATWISFILHRIVLPRFGAWYIQAVCRIFTISQNHIRYDAKTDREFVRCSPYFNVQPVETASAIGRTFVLSRRQ